MAATVDSLWTDNILEGALTSDNVMQGDMTPARNVTYALVGEAGARVLLNINSADYKMTAILQDKDGNTIYTSNVIDLPLESMVVSGSYDSLTKKVILTLQNGNTVEFSIADLVAGLQSEITSENKLSSDLVDDTNHTNKFVTASDKTNWNAKVGTTDYATNTVAGVIKVGSNAISINPSDGKLYAEARTYSNYNSAGDNIFISKGTLENVITGKDLTTKAYVDGLVGDIATALDTIQGEVI